MRRPTKSISLPIILGSIAVLLTVALLVGWTLVSIQNLSTTKQVAQNTWLLVAGIVSFSVIVAITVLFSVFLVREILEVQRQYTFIDSVTHELKSPLASLKLCLETLGRSELKEAQREELRGMMLDDVDRLNLFIDDVLESSRITHGRRSVVMASTELAPVAGRCVQTVLKRYRLPEGAVTVQLEPGLEVQTDGTALETVLRNLLDNAVKYSAEPIQVRLSGQRYDGGIKIEVVDQGIGIPRQHMRRIFDRFYRVPREAVYTRRGTGLGLYVVASLVRSLGGRLEAHSDGEGKGTRMTIFLPPEPPRGMRQRPVPA